MNQSFFNENGMKNSFEGGSIEETSTPFYPSSKKEPNSIFISHSTEFGFVSSLLDLKTSNSFEKERVYFMREVH